MRIKQISVSGLFGIFDHVIPLNTKERITIIHGLNGFGKTNILRILDGIFNSHHLALKNILFDDFKVEFDNNTTIEIVKETHKVKKEDKNSKIIFNLYQSKFKEKSFNLKNRKISISDLRTYTNILKDRIPGLEKINSERWLYIPTKEILSPNEIIDRFEDVIPSIIRLGDGIKIGSIPFRQK